MAGSTKIFWQTQTERPVALWSPNYQHNSTKGQSYYYH